MNFDEFVNDIKKNNWNIHGVEVYEGGELIHSYGDTEKRYPIYSATKTITSLAVGMAVDDGKMAIDKSILSYMPEKVLEKLSAQQLNIWKKITTERLLTMSVAGFPFRPEGEHWLEDTLNTPVENPDTRMFSYSNVSAYLVGVAVSNAVGRDTYEFLNERLFVPLGIINPPYERCPNGYFYGASKMELSVNELSKIGLLLANGGIYNGKQLVSRSYVEAATSCQIANESYGYGYYIWRNAYGYSINGKWEQKCYVLPESGRIITYLADIRERCEQLHISVENNLFT